MDSPADLIFILSTPWLVLKSHEILENKAAADSRTYQENHSVGAGKIEPDITHA